MFKKKSPATHLSPQKEIVFLVLAIAVLFGFYVRLANVLPSAFPINDGGLFYNMTRDLQSNRYLLPATTSYNSADIPFAYPPLPFYLAGFLADIFKWDLLELFRLLPAIISMAALPGLYWLARDLLKSETQAALACLVFALTPGAFSWLIMGGGLTRGLGLAFALLTLHQAYLLYQTQKASHALATAIFAAGTILSHPEMAVHTVASALVMFLFWGRSKKGLGLSILTAIPTLLLTAPWWLNLVSRHGIAPVLAAGETSWHSLDSIPALLLFNFTNEPSLTISGCLAILGLIVSLSRKNYFLIAWLGFIYLSEPRSAPLYLMPLIAMLAALSLDQIIFPGLQPASARSTPANEANPLLANGATKITFAFLIIYLLLGAFTVTWHERRDFTLQESDAAAMQWVKENTPTDSQFVIITGEQPMQDTLSEWFPALTNRISIATVQGYEWKPGGVLLKKMNAYGVLQTCLSQGETCLSNWAQKTNQTFDYVIVRQKTADFGTKPVNTPLAASLEMSTQMKKVFESTGISIFALQTP